MIFIRRYALTDESHPINYRNYLNVLIMYIYDINASRCFDAVIDYRPVNSMNIYSSNMFDNLTSNS